MIFPVKVKGCAVIALAGVTYEASQLAKLPLRAHSARLPSWKRHASILEQIYKYTLQGGEGRCEIHSAWDQGHLILKPNLLILKLLAGYGCLFFGYAPGPDLAYRA
jgi:hypothetical protein